MLHVCFGFCSFHSKPKMDVSFRKKLLHFTPIKLQEWSIIIYDDGIEKKVLDQSHFFEIKCTVSCTKRLLLILSDAVEYPVR